MLKACFFSILCLYCVQSAASNLDPIPEDLNSWKERGAVLTADPSIDWEAKQRLGIAGFAKVGDIYYLFYTAGFDGCWNKDGDSNHQSVGVATSKDGLVFTRHKKNPVLVPHDFVSVGSEEEGIRTAYIRYLPEMGQFYGFFGVESPGGHDFCPFRSGPFGWLDLFCECNVEVDAAVYLATSKDGFDWSVEGKVDGGYSSPGNETYSSAWVFNGEKFFHYITVAEGGMSKAASIGRNPMKLDEKGKVEGLEWGWSGVDAYLHSDNNTVTLIYNPLGGEHPGAHNDKLYFATTFLDDWMNVTDERVVAEDISNQHFIYKGEDKWFWYYRQRSAHNQDTIQLRTHPLGSATPVVKK